MPCGPKKRVFFQKPISDRSMYNLTIAKTRQSYLLQVNLHDNLGREKEYLRP